MIIRPTIANIKTLSAKGINLLSLTAEQATDVSVMESIVRTCDPENADAILSALTVGDLYGQIRESLQPPQK